MKHILLLIFPLLLSHTVAGQCRSEQKERPDWVDGYFYESNNSYIEAVTAIGPTEEDARNKAASIIIGRRNLVIGQRVKVQVFNGNITLQGSDELTVKSRVIDEYREWCGPGEYRVSLLMQTAKNPEYTFERVEVTRDYPFSPRVFIPGMAQLHKGSKTKGVLFIVGEAAMIGGIVAAESLRASYSSKVGSTHDVASIKTNINNARNWKNIRSGFITGAAALYAWNVVDGWVGKSKKHVTFMGDNTLNITPFASPYGNGLALTVNF
jgi:hypothetical protein